MRNTDFLCRSYILYNAATGVGLPWVNIPVTEAGDAHSKLVQGVIDVVCRVTMPITRHPNAGYSSRRRIPVRSDTISGSFDYPGVAETAPAPVGPGIGVGVGADVGAGVEAEAT